MSTMLVLWVYNYTTIRGIHVIFSTTWTQIKITVGNNKTKFEEKNTKDIIWLMLNLVTSQRGELFLHFFYF